MNSKFFILPSATRRAVFEFLVHSTASVYLPLSHSHQSLTLTYFVFYFIPELQPYKYAGYPMLIKTIRLETVDNSLFSKSAPLLTAASELAYHTINCSALNAEELRRENGIEVKTVV